MLKITLKVVIFVVLTLSNFQNFVQFHGKQKLGLESFQMILTFTIIFLSRSSAQQIWSFLLNQGIIFPENKAYSTVSLQKRPLRNVTVNLFLSFTVFHLNRHFHFNQS